MRTYTVQFSDAEAKDIEICAKHDARDPEAWLSKTILDVVYGHGRHFPPVTDAELEAYRAERNRTPRITLKARDRAKIFERDGGKCRHCDGQILFNETWHIDHLVPISKGGTNDVANLALSCVRCNLEKKDKLP